MVQEGDDVKSPVDGYYAEDQALKVEVVGVGDVDKEHKDQADAGQPKKKKFIIWYLTKSKWIAALVGSIVVALGLILLILWFAVAVPIFQSNANKVGVTLNHLDIVSVEKGADVKTLGVNLSLRLKHDLHVHASTDAAKADLLFDGEVFAAVDLPELDLKTGEQEYDLVIASETTISNSEVFTKLADALITQKNITVDAHAKLKAHAFGLSKSGIKFDRSLELSALNNFKDPEPVINLMSITDCSSENIKIAINATIDNVALVGLDGIGALNLSLYYEQDYLGYAVSALPDLGIPRGPSTQMFDVVIQNSTDHLPIVGKMVKGIALGAAQFYLTGANEYSTQVGLLEAPLKQLNMSILYKDQLKKVKLNPKCDLISLITLALHIQKRSLLHRRLFLLLLLIQSKAVESEGEERYEMQRPAPPKKASSTLGSESTSSSSLVDHFPSLRQFFTRSTSQPNLDTLSSNNASDSFSSGKAALLPPSPEQNNARAHVFGACTQVLATVITALFRAINTFEFYDETVGSSDNNTTRRAKLLYVQLLDKAQKERGEWQGFAEDKDYGDSSVHGSTKNQTGVRSESAMDILEANLAELSRDETFAVLNELVEVSFKSIRGPLVDAEIYASHKKQLAKLSLGIPVSLTALLEIRAILNELARENKLCVFRLLTLWHAMAVANELQDLTRTIEEKHHLVFSERTELEFVATRKVSRHDAVAIALLHILVLYHDVLFSDIEFLLVKQELQLSPGLRNSKQDSATVSPTTPETPLESAADQTADRDIPRHEEDSSHAASEPEMNQEAPAQCLLIESILHDLSQLGEVRVPEVVEPQVLPDQGAATEEPPTPEPESSRMQEQLDAHADTEVESRSAATSSNAQARTRVHPRHGPIVSIRSHSLSPRKTKSSNPSPFRSLTVSTAPPSPRGKAHDSRGADALSGDASYVSDRCSVPAGSGTHEGSSKGRHNYSREKPQLVRESHATPPPKPESTSASAALVSAEELPETRHEHEIKAELEVPTKQSPPDAPTVHAKKPAHEITDLANTYFSFSFVATTMCTMATMAFYAIRKHHHHHQ